MSVASGTKLGPSEVVSPIGAGARGEVYRARDTKLWPEAPSVAGIPGRRSEQVNTRWQWEIAACKSVPPVLHHTWRSSGKEHSSRCACRP